MPNPQDIFQLAQQTATQVTASPENWRRFLYTAAHNYHTTYLNQLLIHAQRPDATACATMKYWNEQAHRKVMYGSKSIIILQRHQGVPTAKRVFSMTDTVLTGDKAAAPWEVTDAIRPLLMQVNSVGSLMDRATEQVVSLSDRANRVMANSIEDSTLGWSHPEDQRFILQEVAAQSTLYMICIRLGIPVREEDFPAFQNVTQFDTSRISLCLGGYVQAAAEPLLDELGHEVMQLARDSVAIQAEPVHNTDARIPGNDGETLRCIRECAAKAQQDNCKIVGTSADERYGWLLRPGYREMMRQVKAGKIDCIYIYRMRQISGKEQHLFCFFQQVMRYGIKVVTLEYSLRDRLHEYRLGIESVRLDRDAYIICNDEGKLLPLPPNRLYGPTDFFAGPFLICGDGGEDLISLTDSQITKYEKKYHSPLIFLELYPKPITLKCTPELYAKCMGEEHQHDTQENEHDER